MIKLNRSKAAFGRHSTFPLRYAWLTKGVRAIRSNPGIFAAPEDAMVELGVGRNMVSAIQYWLQVTGIVEFGEQTFITPLGAALLGDDGDPYLEDEATLWIIHWLIVSNPELATGFYWFFNRFAMPRFHEPEMRQSLTDFAEQELQVRRSASTIKSDSSTLLRMYAAGQGSGNGEDPLDSPLASLRLIEVDPIQGYRSPRASRPFLPPLALHFALTDRFHSDRQTPALPVRVLLYGGDDWPAVGAAFRLTEEGLMGTLARVLDRYPDHYELRDTAGVHQLYRRRVVEPRKILVDAYRERRA